MLKKISLLLVCLALFLTACQASSTNTPDPFVGETPVAGETPLVPTPFATRTNSPEATSVEAETTGEPAGEAACTVISPQPTPGPTEQSLFPPVSDSDWVVGSDTADVTITEYSDFQ